MIAFLGQFETAMDVVIKETIFNGYHAVAESVLPSVPAFAALAVTIYAVLGALGRQRMPLSEALILLFKMTLVLAVIRQWDLFSDLVVNFFVRVPEHIAHALSYRLNHQPAGMTDTLQAMIQADMGIAADQIEGIWSYFSIPMVVAIMILVCDFVFVIFLFAVFLFCKIALAGLLVLAPLIMLSVFFRSTQNIFNQYVSTLIYCGLLPICIQIVMFVMSELHEVAVTMENVLPSVSSFDSGFAVVTSYILALPFLKFMMTTAGKLGSNFSFTPVSDIGGVSSKVSGAMSALSKMFGGKP